MNNATIWLFLIFGYSATIAIELPVLWYGLSPRHSASQKLTCGLLLTAFTYPIVVMVLPATFSGLGMHSQGLYLAVAETFAPVAEVLFFRYLIDQKLLARIDRDAIAIVLANVASFLAGEAGLSGILAEAITRLTAAE